MNFDPTITIGALTLLLALAGFMISTHSTLRKIRRENASDAKGTTDEIKKQLESRHAENRDLLNEMKVTLGERVSKLEGTATAFVPRAEIEAKFEHEKANRITQGNAMVQRAERVDADIRQMMIQISGLAQRQDGHDQQMAEIKALVREGFREQSEKIDRLSDAMRGGKA